VAADEKSPVDRLKAWRPSPWVVARLALALLGLVLVAGGFTSGRDVVLVAGLFVILVAAYFESLESVSALGFNAKKARKVARDAARETLVGAHIQPAVRGLSKPRIMKEGALYDAILRLQTARFDDPQMQVRDDVEAKITAFWSQPESLKDPAVEDLTTVVVAYIPEALKGKTD
jgi:hypothetical protein